MDNLGPYRTLADLQESPLALALVALDEQTDGDPGPLVYGLRVAHLFAACQAARVELGAMDRRTLLRLAGLGDNALVQVIIGLLARANNEVSSTAIVTWTGGPDGS